jgi:hypothetical protein
MASGQSKLGAPPLQPSARYVAEELSLGYASTVSNRRRPTVDFSGMLLGAITNLDGIRTPSCPHRGTTGVA